MTAALLVEEESFEHYKALVEAQLKEGPFTGDFRRPPPSGDLRRLRVGFRVYAVQPDAILSRRGPTEGRR